MGTQVYVETHTFAHKGLFKNIKAEAMMSTQRICKVRKSSATTLWDKELTKVMWICLVLLIYCWAWPDLKRDFHCPPSVMLSMCLSCETCSQGLGLFDLLAGASALGCVECHYCHSTFWVLTLIFPWPLSHWRPFIFWDHAMNMFFVWPCTSFRTVEVSNWDSVSLKHFLDTKRLPWR